MKLQFAKATKEKARLRLAIFGPSGAGKTYSALRIATGLGGRIAVIDTERGSASKYADRFDFDVLELPQTDIATYVEAIKAAAGYPVLIVDSLSHAWRELLAEVDRLARARYSGNTWSAWSEGTPKQNQLIDAILGFDGHIIVTMRSRTEWVIQQNDRGKQEPRRIGTSPEQGKGIEYEFDLLMEISAEHVATITKDRTGRFQDAMLSMPDEAFGQALAEWLSTGAEPEAKPRWTQDASVTDRFWAWCGKFGLSEAEVLGALGVVALSAYTGSAKEAAMEVENYVETLKQAQRDTPPADQPQGQQQLM